MIDVASSYMWINTTFIVLSFIIFFVFYLKGLSSSLYDLLAFGLLLLITLPLSSALANSIGLVSAAQFSEGALGTLTASFVNQVIWFVLLFIIGSVIFFILKKPLLKRLPFKINRKLDKALSFLISGTFVFLLGTFMSAALLTPIFANGEQVIDNSFLHFFKASGASMVNTINEEVKEVGIITKLIEQTPLTIEDQPEIIKILVSFKLPEDVATTLSKYPLKQEVTQEEKTRLLEYAQEEGLTLEDVRTFLKSLGLGDDVIEELISNAN
ncbi:MAG: hypothetical protein KGZ38_05680 [Erysipelothrix sp.]|jgi:hypothetical protein|nr:hypothetical protein [Erysipelothrix sp.]